MELVVRKNDLLRELQLFQGIVERKNTIPILANVLMEAKGDEVRFLATDLEVGLRSKCAATVAKGGSLTLPAKKFYEIVKSLPDTDIRIAEDKGGVKVAADRFDSRMQTLPREDFPTLPESGGAATVNAAARGAEGDGREDAVRDHRRGHAVFSERRAVRAAARLDESGRHRRSSSGARHRDARRQGTTDGEENKAILPKKTLGELGAAAGAKATATSATSAARTTCSSTSAAAADLADDRRAVSGLRAGDSEGQRQAHRVRARSADERGQARGAAVERAIARGEVSDRQRARSTSRRAARISAKRRKRCPVDYSGAAMQICFNAQYVLDFLAAVTTDVVSLELKDEVSQAVMKPVGAEGYDYTYVIMPMRV